MAVTAEKKKEKKEIAPNFWQSAHSKNYLDRFTDYICINFNQTNKRRFVLLVYFIYSFIVVSCVRTALRIFIIFNEIIFIITYCMAGRLFFFLKFNVIKSHKLDGLRHARIPEIRR